MVGSCSVRYRREREQVPRGMRHEVAAAPQLLLQHGKDHSNRGGAGWAPHSEGADKWGRPTRADKTQRRLAGGGGGR